MPEQIPPPPAKPAIVRAAPRPSPRADERKDAARDAAIVRLAQLQPRLQVALRPYEGSGGVRLARRVRLLLSPGEAPPPAARLLLSEPRTEDGEACRFFLDLGGPGTTGADETGETGDSGERTGVLYLQLLLPEAAGG